MSLEKDLPKPDPGKNKWPWVQDAAAVFPIPGIVYPKITVVTPSYNQGRFIEETILSVLHQNYPNLEYIVMDGGSNDETVEVLKKYDAKIHFWVSEKDKGQSDAINKGFARATGDIICWLNSDDYYFPGTLFKVAEKLKAGEKALFFGETLHINEHTGHSYKSRAAQNTLLTT